MARRPNTGSRETLSALELAALRQRLADMKPFEVEIYYKASHNACGYNVNGRVPSPRAVQEFVQAWKALRKMR
ncbi:MAG: hypothetical protein WDO73_31880, partial [Ignavibacteriota bacterium]